MNQAAKITRKNKAVIWRDEKSSKLSSKANGKGQKVYEPGHGYVAGWEPKGKLPLLFVRNLRSPNRRVKGKKRLGLGLYPVTLNLKRRTRKCEDDHGRENHRS